MSLVKNYISCQRRRTGKKQTTFYNYPLLLHVYIFLLPKYKVNAEGYSDHATSERSQQSDIQFLQQRSEQF